MCAIGQTVTDALWKELMDHKAYAANKEELRKAVEEFWLLRLAGVIKGFELANKYYGFKVNNEPIDLNYMLNWMQRFAREADLVEAVHELIKKEIREFSVHAVTFVNRHEVLLNTYNYTGYQTVRDNILSDGLTEDNLEAFIDNMDNFPVNLVDYSMLLNSFGDREHEIRKIMEFLGAEDAYRKLQRYYLDKRISDIAKIRNFKKYEEEQLKDYRRTIEQEMELLGMDETAEVSALSAIRDQLAVIDQNLRTVRGKLYETREEAFKVRKDYEYLASLIKDIDFGSYDLSDQDEIARIKKGLLEASFASDAFQKDSAYILDELKPVLAHHIQLQTWRKQLYESREPWILAGEILQSVKGQFKYWDFKGLKKYYPAFLEHERPIFFYQISLFGWSNYFVLTNKRGLRVTKNSQEEIVLDEKISVVCQNGHVLFRREEPAAVLDIPLKYPENQAGYFQDVLGMLAVTLSTCEESLFDLPENFYSDVREGDKTGTGFQKQFQDMFQGKVAPFFKNTKKTFGILGGDKDNGFSKGTDTVQYCTQCGAMVKKTDNFCCVCGSKVK